MIAENARELITAIADKIKSEYEPEKIILFGSYAYGNPNKDSDIDFLIIKDTKDRPIDRRVLVSTIASDPKRLIPFEPLVFTPKEIEERLKIGDQFLREIIQKGQIIYEK
jgi:predicted nucleotidyltransferase